QDVFQEVISVVCEVVIEGSDEVSPRGLEEAVPEGSLVIYGNLQIVAGKASVALADAICLNLGIPRTPAKVDKFPDGEIDVRIEDHVRGNDVFVVQSTCPDVNDHLMELLLLIDALRRASAGRITAV